MRDITTIARRLVLLATIFTSAAAGYSQILGDKRSTFIDENTIRAILNEASGEAAYAHTRTLSSMARYPVSRGFRQAAEYVAAEARKIGLQNVQIESFDTDATGWDPVEAELTMIEPQVLRLADMRLIPVSIAGNSNNADIESDLIDVGEGTAAAHYAGLDVTGKIVLASGPPRRVQAQAVFQRGAAGIVSYSSNSFFGVEPSPDVVSWNRIAMRDAQGRPGGFAFMLSPSAGSALSRRISAGPKVRVRAHVRVETFSPGKLEMVTAEIPGTSGTPPRHLVFSAHLDHQNPGANDNASGSAALLEIARTLIALTRAGRLPSPTHTIRFWWVTEIQGTEAYFRNKPEEAAKIALNINIDQAGGDKDYRNDLVFIREPEWLPTLANDLFEDLVEYMQNNYADVYHKPNPLFVAPTGRQDEPLTYRAWQYAELTDHIVFERRGREIPSISFAYPSFNYIHTSEDSIEHIDATTLKRSVFFGTAIAAYVLRRDASGFDPFAETGRAILRIRIERAKGEAATLIEASTAERLAADYARARQIITTAYDSAERAYRTHGAGVFATNTAAADLAALEARYREIGERLGVAIPGR
jgi:hypothetical protein